MARTHSLENPVWLRASLYRKYSIHTEVFVSTNPNCYPLPRRAVLHNPRAPNGPARKKALAIPIALNPQFRYEISAKRIRTICNCAVGSDASGSEDPRRPFIRIWRPIFYFRQRGRLFWRAQKYRLNPDGIAESPFNYGPTSGISTNGTRLEVPCHPIGSVATLIESPRICRTFLLSGFPSALQASHFLKPQLVAREKANFPDCVSKRKAFILPIRAVLLTS